MHLFLMGIANRMEAHGLGNDYFHGANLATAPAIVDSTTPTTIVLPVSASSAVYWQPQLSLCRSDALSG